MTLLVVAVVRRFEKEDFFPITKLLYEIFPERYNPQLLINLFEFFPEGILVAEENKEIVGFLAGVVSFENIAKILLLGVGEGYRKRGVGSLLITRFFKNMVLKGIRTIELEVEINNREAISFYKRHGFSVSKIVRSFYRNGEDAYLMVRHL
jgi:ribosomal-protein-alanine N-acetyltransferase